VVILSNVNEEIRKEKKEMDYVCKQAQTSQVLETCEVVRKEQRYLIIVATASGSWVCRPPIKELPTDLSNLCVNCN